MTFNSISSYDTARLAHPMNTATSSACGSMSAAGTNFGISTLQSAQPTEVVAWVNEFTAAVQGQKWDVVEKFLDKLKVDFAPCDKDYVRMQAFELIFQAALESPHSMAYFSSYTKEKLLSIIADFPQEISYKLIEEKIAIYKGMSDSRRDSDGCFDSLLAMFSSLHIQDNNFYDFLRGKLAVIGHEKKVGDYKLCRLYESGSIPFLACSTPPADVKMQACEFQELKKQFVEHFAAIVKSDCCDNPKLVMSILKSTPKQLPEDWEEIFTAGLNSSYSHAVVKEHILACDPSIKI